MDDPVAFSLEELTWLKASQLLELPLTPPSKTDDIFMQDLSPSSSTDSSSSSRRYNLPSPRIASTKNAPVTPPRRGDSPRSEWIYRQPKSPASTPRSGTSNTRPRPRPQTGYLPHRNYHSPTVSSLSRTVSTTSTRTVHKAPPAWSLEKQASTSSSLTTPSTGQFWSAILHPRSRSERSIPLLKTIPSSSQISLGRPDDPVSTSLPCTPKRKISSPRLMSTRPPSVSSLSSTSSSPSPSSSRSESPITPISASSSPYLHRRSTPYHYRPHRRHTGETDSLLSASCPPPSKSILTRTPSVSTKDSTHTIPKSVKFAAAPTVHYARAGYWDVELRPTYECADEEETMGINVAAMDLDADPFANYQAQGDAAVRTLDIARMREIRARQTTPTPASERERARAKGLKRLVSLSRGAEPSMASGAPSAPPTTTTTTTGAGARARSPPSAFAAPKPRPARPAISTPYALGAYAGGRRPYMSDRENSVAGSSTDLEEQGHAHGYGQGQGRGGLRSAPSMESVRSSKSAAARSVRSLGSVKSTASIGGLKAWFGRTLGWAEQP